MKENDAVIVLCQTEESVETVYPHLIIDFEFRTSSRIPPCVCVACDDPPCRRRQTGTGGAASERASVRRAAAAVKKENNH